MFNHRMFNPRLLLLAPLVVAAAECASDGAAAGTSGG